MPRRGPCRPNGLCNACKMRRGRTACFWFRNQPGGLGWWTCRESKVEWTSRQRLLSHAPVTANSLPLLQPPRRRRSTLALHFNSLIGQARCCSWCGPRPCFRDAILHLAVTPASLDHWTTAPTSPRDCQPPQRYRAVRAVQKRAHALPESSHVVAPQSCLNGVESQNTSIACPTPIVTRFTLPHRA
jgi:hypothetical protein